MPQLVKIPLKSSWIQFSTKIVQFDASETSHPSENIFTRIRQQLLELSATFKQLPLYSDGKYCFEIHGIRIVTQTSTPQSNCL